MFAKKPNSIGDSEDEVETIMATTQSINEYLDNSRWDADQHEELLRSEMVWDHVDEEFYKNFGEPDTNSRPPKTEPDTEPDTDPDKEAHKEPEKETKKESKPDTNRSTKKEVDQSDQDLLDELMDL